MQRHCCCPVAATILTLAHRALCHRAMPTDQTRPGWVMAVPKKIDQPKTVPAKRTAGLTTTGFGRRSSRVAGHLLMGFAHFPNWFDRVTRESVRWRAPPAYRIAKGERTTEHRWKIDLRRFAAPVNFPRSIHPACCHWPANRDFVRKRSDPGQNWTDSRRRVGRRGSRRLARHPENL